MKQDDSLMAQRHENVAQEKRNERNAETKTTARLQKILAMKLGAGKPPAGVVYETVDLKPGRHVALKFLPDELANDA